jgi:TolB-like protein/Flp pilus assembly protein TadD
LADVFISYAREDRAAVEHLAAALELEGWSVWWDRHIEGGAAFARAIEQELNASKAVIVAWSGASVQSDWVKDEAATARDQGKLVAIALDGTTAPLGFKQYHVIDLAGWDGDATRTAYRDLARSVAARVQGPKPAAAAPAHDPGPTSRASGPAPTRRWLLVAGVMLAAVIAVLYLLNREPEPPAGQPVSEPRSVAGTAGADAPPATAAGKSIAVLPFANRSTREEDAFFAEGIHDDLLAQLARIEDVRVISRTSVMRYAGTDKPIPEIASELGVGAVLEGGVQRAGNRVRINVQLIDGRTDDHLWAETFDRELTVENLFDIQSDITEAIASALQLVFSGDTRVPAGRLPTSNTEAYNKYLLGNTLSRYELRDPAKFEQATKAYGEAVALDPDFLAAHARKAVAHMTLSWWGVGTAENIRLAEESIARAQELAPQSIETQIAEGYYRYWIKADYQGAFAALRRVLEQSPQNARLWSLYGAVARRAGDLQGAAVPAFERAAALDPQDADIAANIAVTHAYLGQQAQARQWLSRAWSLSPDSRYNINAEAAVLYSAADVDTMWRRYEELRRQFPTATDEVDVNFLSLATELREPDRLAALNERLAEADLPGDSVQIGVLFARTFALERLGRKAEARALAREIGSRIRALGPSASERTAAAFGAIALDAFLGRRNAALSAADTLLQNPPEDQLWPIEQGPALIQSFARVGDAEAALDLAERVMDRYSPAHFGGIVRDTVFDEYRDLPRYQQLLGRYEAWRSSQAL